VKFSEIANFRGVPLFCPSILYILMKKSKRNNNNSKSEEESIIGIKRRRVRGKGRKTTKNEINPNQSIENIITTSIKPHNLEGVYVITSDKEFIATKNLTPGESIYGEQLIKIEENRKKENNEKEKEKDKVKDKEKEENMENQKTKVYEESSSENDICPINIKSPNDSSSESEICIIKHKVLNEYRVWNKFYSKLGASIENGINYIYIKKGSKVLYLGAGNDSYSTITHISDLVGEEGKIYAVEISEIKGIKLKSIAKKRKNIVPIIKDARNPYFYRNSIKSLVDCIYISFSDTDLAKIISLNAGFFLKSKGGFISIVNANKVNSNRIPLIEKFNDQIKILKQYNLYSKDFVSLEPFFEGYCAISGLYKPYRDSITMDSYEEDDENK
jgi:rRNA 2'-O-methyltransferase fibrillarin